jgi:purine-nucleoside phosphorylase
MSDPAHAVLEVIRRGVPAPPPEVGIVLGSGVGALADSVMAARSFDYGELPGFPRSGVSGHAGRLLLGRLAGVEVAVLQGRSHYYESGRSDAMRVPLAVLQALGCRHLIVTNAAGSLRKQMGPGSLMLISDHIFLGGPNPLLGETDDDRFVDLSMAYDAGLGSMLKGAAGRTGIALHEGVYMWFGGPSFETPAEIRAARILGADAVGMSTVPEVIIARRLGLLVAAISIITNSAAGLGKAPLSHAQTKTNAAGAAEALLRLLTDALPEINRE